MPDRHDQVDEAVAEGTGAGAFQARIRFGDVEILADEPVSGGGPGSGPSPYQLLAAALASCTTMTIRLYAARKGWPVENVRTAVGHNRDPGATPIDRFTRRIELTGDLDHLQRVRLLEIADHCPVHRTLSLGARIETLTKDPTTSAGPATDHLVDMEALIAVCRSSVDFVQ